SVPGGASQLAPYGARPPFLAERRNSHLTVLDLRSWRSVATRTLRCSTSVPGGASQLAPYGARPPFLAERRNSHLTVLDLRSWRSVASRTLRCSCSGRSLRSRPSHLTFK